MGGKVDFGFSTCLLCLFLAILCCLQQVHSADANVTNITFIFMLSAPKNGTLVQQNTESVGPAVDMALEAINGESSLLPGYRLTYGGVQLNSECDRHTSLEEFFTDVTTTPPNKVFLLGCGCSIATGAVGEISSFWQIIQMAYASQAPLLSDRSQYTLLFRSVPSALSIVSVVRGVMNQYNWKKLVILTQTDNEFTQVRDVLTNPSMSDITTATVSFNSNQNVANLPLFSHASDYRIYFLNMYPYHARRVICAAYRTNERRYYPRYVWLVLGWYPEEWWKESVSGPDQTVTCSDSELKTVLNRSLVLSHYPTANDNMAATNVGMTSAEFFAEYRSRLQNTTLQETYASPFAYDALWSLALAMNMSLPYLPYSLSDFDNSNKGRGITDIIVNNLTNLTFTGVTGAVSFDKNGTRKEVQPRVSQYGFGSSVTPYIIGRINNVSNPMMEYVNNQTDSLVWPIIIPYDGTPILETTTILTPVFIVIYIGSSIGVIFGIVCAIVNFIFRKRKIIRLTSPNLNYLIILGCLIFCLSAYFYAYPSTSNDTVLGLCYARAYTQLIGYSLCFGTICAKMWRVYFIFHNPTPKKRKAIKDWHLLLLVLGLCLIDIVYISIALAIDRDYGPKKVPDKEKKSTTNEYGIRINYENVVCDSKRSIIWIGIVFFEKFLVQAAAVFFAIKTRKVKIKVLNDAKWISIIIYVTSVFLTVMLIGAIALDDYINADAAIFSSGLIAVAIVVLLILFLPKWYSLYKDPKGEKIFEHHSAPSMHQTMADQELMNSMSKHIEQLESRLGKYETVTPFQPRKRVLSSLDDNPRLASLRPPHGGRSLSYSPGACDVTASLPIGRLVFTPTSPRSPNETAGSGDSGVNGSTKSSRENSEDGGNKSAISDKHMIVLKEEEDGKTESTKQLMANDDNQVATSPV